MLKSSGGSLVITVLSRQWGFHECLTREGSRVLAGQAGRDISFTKSLGEQLSLSPTCAISEQILCSCPPFRLRNQRYISLDLEGQEGKGLP